MGRPRASLLGSFDPKIIARISFLREEYPGWGPHTIYSELMDNIDTKSLKLPKPSTIAFFLKHRGLVKEYEKNISLPGKPIYMAEYPHQVWQLDGQGALQIQGLGRINFINVKDVYSRVYCGALPLKSTCHNGCPTADDYRQSLRKSFMEFGLPAVIQTDHASAFFENKGKSPFPTRFHLWLISLGIQLIFSRKYRPTDQAVVERSHQTIEAQVMRKSGFISLEQLQVFTDYRRKKLNNRIASKACQNKPPLVAYPQAKYSGRNYPFQSEQELMDFERVYQYLAQGQWIRQGTSSSGKKISLGGEKYYVAGLSPRAKARITFDQQTKLLSFYDLSSKIKVATQPIKGINYEKLQGEHPCKGFYKGQQLKIPFITQQKVSMTFLEKS